MTMVTNMVRRVPCPSSNSIAVTKRLAQVVGLESVLNNVRFIHVAGTKGKGTCAAFTSGLLTAQGHQTGLFVSPHVMDVRERVLINGKMISKAAFAQYFFELNDRLDAIATHESAALRESSTRSSFFRFSFLLALHIFNAERVTHAVVEVGIGGRLDDTNIINPAVCLITSLGMDHMELLGDTIDKIASEKAGIMKKGVPCFSDPQSYYPSTREVLKRRAIEVDTSLVFLDRGVMPHNWPPLAIDGRHCLINAQLAVAATRYLLGSPLVGVLTPVEKQALSTTTLVGRCQVISLSNCTLYLDGAHTMESVLAAQQWFVEASGRANAQRRGMLYYSSRDPNLLFKGFIEHARCFERVVFAPIQSHDCTEFGWKHNEAWRSRYSEVPCVALPQVPQSLDDVISAFNITDSTDNRHLHLFVTGSFYLVGAVLRWVEAATMTEIYP